MEALKELIDPTVIPAQIIGFLLLWYVLARYLFRPVMNLIRNREEEIRSTYQAAEDTRTQAEELRSDYERRLSGIEAEARTRLKAAVKEAEEAKDDILKDARKRSEDVLQRAKEDLAREREKVLVGIREEVVDLSLTAAGKLIGESLDKAKHRKLVDDFIKGIGTAK